MCDKSAAVAPFTSLEIQIKMLLIFHHRIADFHVHILALNLFISNHQDERRPILQSYHIIGVGTGEG